MGGNLAWTLRLEDGTEYRMDRWTNPMPELIVTPAFLEGEPAALEEALSDWMAMKTDWDGNGATGDFAFPMTSAYAPYPFGLKPSEYGIVVTDFVSQTILSLQGYTDLGGINPASSTSTSSPPSAIMSAPAAGIRRRARRPRSCARSSRPRPIRTCAAPWSTP